MVMGIQNIPTIIITPQKMFGSNINGWIKLAKSHISTVTNVKRTEKTNITPGPNNDFQ